jgi:hypothetical protein
MPQIGYNLYTKVGGLAFEVTKPRQQPKACEGWSDRYSHNRYTLLPLRTIGEICDLIDGQRRPRKYSLSVRRHDDSPSMAIEQAHPGPFFDGPDPSTHGGVCDVELERSGRERAESRGCKGCDETLQWWQM